MGREIDEVYCSCGGNPKPVVKTKKEVREYGCHRDDVKSVGGCCARAYRCHMCGTRWLLALDPPDYY